MATHLRDYLAQGIVVAVRYPAENPWAGNPWAWIMDMEKPERSR